MRIRTLVATLAMAPALAVGAGTAVAAPSATADSCASTMIFEVGGHGDPEASVYDRTNATLPAGTAFIKIRYSASIAPFPGDTVSMDDSVAEGIAKLDAEVRTFHAACPDSHISISGYSQGAIVAGDELNALSQEDAIPHGQINGVLYGDPRRPGVNGGPGGIEGNLPTILPGLSMRGPRAFGDIAVQEICNKNDGICHSENPITNLLGFANGVAGYFLGDHAYDIDPSAVSGSGDQLIDQPPRVPHGAPLPLPIGTPWEMWNGDLSRAQSEVGSVRGLVAAQLTPEMRDRLAEFPWLSVP
ncbi:PE-PPE domain-containing protein [Streptomyces sp. TP-A0874]|uniref:PE-PPE domain-containing protein n=1 Tax=Streptomyces sp. TP-A0874 TaxID=549819 RepID=UPI000AD6E690|nr:PE-PPE domain-containing protein [Streptomyces sp. TP-A0874]